MADTDTAGLRDNPIATSIFNNSVHAMDECYHDFKTSMLRQLGVIQMIDRENMVQLHAKNQDLERRLALSEEAQARFENELEVEKTKVKTANGEATSWKAKYEGLKGTLQGALGQRF